MSKKWALSLVLAGEALIYLFLFVAFPMFKEWLYSCEGCTGGKELDIPMLWVAYLIPGFIGAWFILVILVQKRKVKEDE